jgi:hypothetical protein
MDNIDLLVLVLLGFGALYLFHRHEAAMNYGILTKLCVLAALLAGVESGRVDSADLAEWTADLHRLIQNTEEYAGRAR